MRAASAIAIGAGLLVASAMTYRDWWLNPGSVFRGPDGTSWEPVRDTFLSWAWPITLAVGVIGAAVLYLFLRLRRT